MYFSISPKKNRELNTELSDMGLDVTKIKDYMKSLQEEVTYDLGAELIKKHLSLNYY